MVCTSRGTHECSNEQLVPDPLPSCHGLSYLAHYLSANLQGVVILGGSVVEGVVDAHKGVRVVELEVGAARCC